MRELSNNEITSDFIRLPRVFRALCISGELSCHELLMLVWLWMSANPVNGKVTVSYSGLSDELRQKFTINQVTKLILSLKKKGIISYPNQRGKHNAFAVRLLYYPLSNGGFVRSFSENAASTQRTRETPAELSAIPQNFARPNFRQGKGEMTSIASLLGRTPNNENKNENEIEKIDDEKIIRVESFNPGNSREFRCHEIARTLGEKDMRYILHALREYGLPEIERAFGKFQETNPQAIRNKPAYFNVILGEQVSEIKEARRSGNTGPTELVSEEHDERT